MVEVVQSRDTACEEESDAERSERSCIAARPSTLYKASFRKPTSFGTHVSEIDKIEEDLHGLELTLLQATTRKDASQLTQLLTEDFVEVGSVGAAFTREEIIEALARETPTQWTIENLKARPLGAGVVLVTYRATRIRPGERVVSLRSSIWKHDAGRWRMAFHQGTLTKE
jgi:hypothetical protein